MKIRWSLRDKLYFLGLGWVRVGFTFIKSAFNFTILLSSISQILRDSADVANISGLQPFKSGIHRSLVGGYL